MIFSNAIVDYVARGPIGPDTSVLTPGTSLQSAHLATASRHRQPAVRIQPVNGVGRRSGATWRRTRRGRSSPLAKLSSTAPLPPPPDGGPPLKAVSTATASLPLSNCDQEALKSGLFRYVIWHVALLRQINGRIDKPTIRVPAYQT